MPKFRKKPVIVEATQWFAGQTLLPGMHWEEDRFVGERDDGEDCCPYVATIHGQRAWVASGDWVVTEPDGEHHYPCKPDIFEQTYEPERECVPCSKE